MSASSAPEYLSPANAVAEMSRQSAKERDTEVMRLNLVTREIIDTAKAYAVTSTVKRNTAAENKLTPEKYSAAAVTGVVSSEAYRLHSSMTIA